MKPLSNIQELLYWVNHRGGYKLDEALRHWKTKFRKFSEFKRAVTDHLGLQPLEAYAAQAWKGIKVLTVQEALRETNLERRRTMFDCIGVVRLFRALKPQLIDKQVIRKKVVRWDAQKQPFEHQFDDTYELYEIPAKKLFEGTASGRQDDRVFAVRCWCATTHREYWIYVPLAAAVGEPCRPDAIRAIAWTIWLNISDPERIYRQGDLIIAKESATSGTIPWYHLEKGDYLRLMYSES